MLTFLSFNLAMAGLCIVTVQFYYSKKGGDVNLIMQIVNLNENFADFSGKNQQFSKICKKTIAFLKIREYNKPQLNTSV